MTSERKPSPIIKSDLVLSVFHGADLLGRAFEQAGFCVVRACEWELGFDIRDFHCPANKFDGIVGGSPCQDFSVARRSPPIFDGYGVEMLKEFERVVAECQPKWFLHENVSRCPDVNVNGYFVQRFYLNARDVGMAQNRRRRFQFGSLDGRLLQIPRVRQDGNEKARCCVASEKDAPDKRNFSEFCRLQGLPTDFSLPLLHIRKQYHVVGNGVPLPMGLAIAKAIADYSSIRVGEGVALCKGECGQIVEGRKQYCSKTCAKRAERRRKE